VKFLVKKGASPNLKNFWGHVPALSSLVNRSETNIIRYLINHGTDLNTESLYGSTLLSRACERRFPEIVDLLLDKKIKLPTHKNKIMDMIFLAVYIDHLRLFNLLLEKNPGIKLVERAESLLRWAAEHGSVKLFKLFIKKKFNSMSPNIYGNQAVHLAAKGGFIQIIEILLENGVNINARNKLNKTALHIAKENKKMDLARFLISRGADQSPPIFPILKGSYLGQKPPGDKPELFAPGIVCTEILEHSPPVFSKDGKEVFWATDYPTKIIGMKYKEDRWTPPKVMAFNSGMGDSEPVYSPDNNKLFFLSHRSIDGKTRSDRERIWYVNRFGNGWSEPMCLNDIANSYPMHWTISVDNESSIYFASTHGSGYGKHDIYKIEIKDGIYQKPVNMGPVINSRQSEATPFMAPDQSYLIYAIRYPEGQGLQDLVISFKNTDGTWSSPINPGPSINTPGHDLCPVVTPDKKYLFYLSGGDIYWVDAKIIEELKPEELK
jgi:ankyrin repeat protein